MKKKRKNLLVAAFVLAAVLGIGKISEGVRMNETRVLTSNQLNMLLAYGTAQERIDQQAFSDAEKMMLQAVEQAEAYLYRHYPDERFSFVGMDNTSPRNKLYVFTAVSKEEPEETFAVRAQWQDKKDEPFIIMESHYADLKRDELFSMIEDAFAAHGVQAKCDLEIVGLFGETYTAHKTLASALEAKCPVDISGWVLASNVESLESLKQTLETELAEMGLTGGFRIFVVEGVSLDEAIARPRTDKSFVANEIYVSLPAK